MKSDDRSPLPREQGDAPDLKTTVYVVWAADEYGPFGVLGVFSTLEKAKQAPDGLRWNQKWKQYENDDETTWAAGEYEIVMRELDAS